MRAARTTAVVALLLATAVACGDTGALRGAGATPTATSPAKLWPNLSPASSPAYDFDEADTETVKGITVPGDDIHKVDPIAVVRAEIAAHPSDYDGSNAPYRGTAEKISDCADAGTDRSACPVLKPYYRDLTGDGRDDLTLGFRLLPTKMTAVRVYTVEKHRLVQVMANDDAVSGVELAGHSVIIRSPSELAGYEYRVQWTWDADQKAMLLTHDEFLRTGSRKHGVRRATPAPPGSPASPTSPSATP
ncbi:hypothetical protein [Streptomyces sp. N50]|uniref:hypothetical protein n=1 Tax=Streptomyces sp. N50 TaxID=3081765 RepID=UPI0029624276|nr:hypothetical protein [Streptomyces sp. N50]WOX12538.1 hypothetical protein R2B38_28530 [Streptomyces sp. N50]